MNEHDDLEAAALFIHGVACLCNAIGILHNFRRKQWIPFLGNIACFIFHGICTLYHLRQFRR